MEEKRKKRCLGFVKWRKAHLLAYISGLFALKSSSIFLIHILGQMKTHLINLKSNETKCIMKIDVLFEIHMMVLRISAFDEIRENPYLQKGPQFTLFEFKLILINSIPSRFTSLGLIQSFETNPTHLAH